VNSDERTLSLLLDLKKFDVARKWAKMVGLQLLVQPAIEKVVFCLCFFQDVEEKYLLHLIEIEQDFTKAYMVKKV